MNKPLFLGLDIGTYESKGVLVDASGSVVASASRRHSLIVPHSGWAEHRADEDWWRGFLEVTRSLLEQSGIKPSRIEAISVSAIGPCMLPLDRFGTPLMNAVLYGVDTRAVEEISMLDAKIGTDRVIEFNGNPLTSQSVGPKILWLRRNRPEIFEKTATIATSSTYLVYKLTGNLLIDHYTAANFTPLYNSKSNNWDNALSNEIIDLDRLPELKWSNEIAGGLTEQAAKASGLVAGTPVTVGTIDAAAEAVSVGAIGPGDLMVMYGSTMFFVTVTESPIHDRRLWYAPWLFPDAHASLAGLSTSGTLTHWFRNNFACELDTESAFPTLAREASESPKGSRGLIALPYFSGERTPIHDPHAKGCIFGLDLTHSRGDVFRAILEGIAYGTRQVFDTYIETGANLNRLLAVGGGTRNDVWLQAVSDISGIDQTIRKITLGASYGDAFLAALSVGAVSRNEILDWNPVDRIVNSQPSDAYNAGYAIFQQLYQNTRDLMRQLPISG